MTTIKVYDIFDKAIEILVDEEKTEGDNYVQFNAASLSNGVYSYRLQAGEFVETKKMILMK